MGITNGNGNENKAKPGGENGNGNEPLRMGGNGIEKSFPLISAIQFNRHLHSSQPSHMLSSLFSRVPPPPVQESYKSYRSQRSCCIIARRQMSLGIAIFADKAHTCTAISIIPKEATIH